jgi:GNAT superfamily N-acetyltransferase
MQVAVRKLDTFDRQQWEPLWKAYLTFYRTELPDDVTDATWMRFHDEGEPMWAYGAFAGERMVGIAHVILHRSCWTKEPYCYLQDLFTAEGERGRGVGRALIENVRLAAVTMGASRLHWLTHETNTTAQALYEQLATKSGFIQYRIVL